MAFSKQVDDEDFVETFTLFWLFINGVLVFFMQCGFGMLEAGAVRRKNVKNILIKNLVDVCFAAISFWLLGFAVAFGSEAKFIGDRDYYGGECLGRFFGGNGCTFGYAFWFFQFAFAATAATIVSGCVAERTQFGCYILYSTVLTAFAYPLVVHWIWGAGWLFDEGVHDFAGSGVVHATGGMAGLVGTMILGPREGRFSGDRMSVTVNTVDFAPSSVVSMGLGVFILWTGWYGFNTGSTLAIVGNELLQQADLVIVNTTIAPAAGGLTCLIISVVQSYRSTQSIVIPPEPILNGILAGLVSITAGCAVIDPHLAFFVGIVGGFVFSFWSWFLQQLKIDDPLDASPVHYFCGCWGVMAVGFFASEKYSKLAGLDDFGAFMGGDGTLLGFQFLTVIVITAWVGFISSAVFGIASAAGFARVSKEDELAGLDEAHHGGKQKSQSVALEVLARLKSEGMDGTKVAP